MSDLIACYNVTVRGSFYSASGKDRILRSFGPVTFTLPEHVEIPNGKKRVEKIVNGKKVQEWVPQVAKRSVTSENVALWVVQRRLLPTWLAENHPDGTAFRTCQIVPNGIKRALKTAKEIQDPSKTIWEMSIPELSAYCKMKSVNVAVSAFTNVDDARQAVQAELDEMSGTITDSPDAVPAAKNAEESGPETLSGGQTANIKIEDLDPAAELI